MVLAVGFGEVRRGSSRHYGQSVRYGRGNHGQGSNEKVRTVRLIVSVRCNVCCFKRDPLLSSVYFHFIDRFRQVFQLGTQFVSTLLYYDDGNNLQCQRVIQSEDFFANLAQHLSDISDWLGLAKVIKKVFVYV